MFSKFIFMFNHCCQLGMVYKQIIFSDRARFRSKDEPSGRGGRGGGSAAGRGRGAGHAFHAGKPGRGGHSSVRGNHSSIRGHHSSSRGGSHSSSGTQNFMSVRSSLGAPPKPSMSSVIGNVNMNKGIRPQFDGQQFASNGQSKSLSQMSHGMNTLPSGYGGNYAAPVSWMSQGPPPPPPRV